MLLNLKQLERCPTVIGMKASGVKQQGSGMALGIASLPKETLFTRDIGMKVLNMASGE